MDELTGLHRTDAAIIGGGLTGLLLGASLSHEGMKVTILDAGDSLSRPFFDSAAILLAPRLARITAAYGLEIASQYACALQHQLHTLTAEPLPYIQRMPAYAYAIKRSDLPALEAQQALYARLRMPVHAAPDAGGCPFPVERSLYTPDQAIIDLRAWTTALTASIRRQGGKIYRNSRVLHFDGQRICTARGSLLAPVTALTTAFPPGLQDKNLLPLLESRTQVSCCLTDVAPLHSIQQSIHSGGLCLCPAGAGAVAAMDAGRCGTRHHQFHMTQAQSIICQHMPDCQMGPLQYRRIVRTADGLPVIGALPGSHRLCASGLDGSILASMHAASLLTRYILGRLLPEDALYSPSRTLPSSIKKQCRRYAWLQRLQAKVRIAAPECPHCGCRLRYCPPLARWECALCSSAFSMLGQPIDGPCMTPAVISPRQIP